MNDASPAPTAVVTICVVTYGALDWVRRCIAAVREHTAVAYDLVVVDNGSTDGTREWLHSTLTAPSDRFVASPTNSGFSGGNNLAVNHARTPYVCLLNSDAVVTAGWLEPLLHTLDRDATIGIAAPLLLNLDGSVQEAGSNVDSSGRAEPFFYGISSDDPRVGGARAVPYASAACWLLTTALYRRLGGLDCGFGRAYYEDVDFAFRAESVGLRTVVEPRSRVLHAQGASSRSFAEAERLRDTQQIRFARRHAHALAHHSHVYDLPNEPHRFYAARDVYCAWRTLVVDASTAESTEPGASPSEIVTTTTAADAPVVLQDRLFHFSTICAPGEWLDSHRQLLAETQPQAELVAAPR